MLLSVAICLLGRFWNDSPSAELSAEDCGMLLPATKCPFFQFSISAQSHLKAVKSKAELCLLKRRMHWYCADRAESYFGKGYVRYLV